MKQKSTNTENQKAVLQNDNFFFISHRGNSAEVPQNTIESFQSAVELKPDTVLEYDLRWTRDKQIVVMHDPCIDRITDGTGLVKEYVYNELRAFDAGYRFSCDNGQTFPYRGKGLCIVRFEDVLETFPQTKAILHIKVNSIDFIKDVIGIIHKHRAEERVIIGGFYAKVINWVRSYEPALATSFTQAEIICFLFLSRLRLSSRFKGKGNVFIVPEYVNSERPEYKRGDMLQGFCVVTSRFLRNAHQLGYKVFVWTINDAINMHRLVDMGVDGILTDYPRRLLDFLLTASNRT